MAFNWFLVIVTVVVAILTLALSVYLIVIYQHPVRPEPGFHALTACY